MPRETTSLKAVDGADEAGDEGCDDGREERDCGLWLPNLAHGPPAGETSIARECPEHGGHERDRRSDVRYDEDGYENGGGARRVVEDLPKGMAEDSGGTFQSCGDVRCDEEHGDDHGKAERSVEDGRCSHRPGYDDFDFLGHVNGAIASRH